MISNCPCGSGKAFDVCCKPLLDGKEFATSAVQLMRSRYSAYVCKNVDYIIATTHISQRKYYSRKAIEQWSEESDWQKLEILFESENYVEFRAFYHDKNAQLQIHHEKSTFKYEGGEWFFVEGN